MASLGDLASKIQGGKTAPAGTDTLKLLVNGKAFEGWQQISVKRSMKAISGSFELAVVDKWAEDQTAWQIKPGDSCTLMIGEDTLVTGYVDAVSSSIDATTKRVAVSGRDKTGDLVDCSADHKTGSISNVTLLELAKKLAAPFGVGVKALVTSSEKWPAWKIQQGESIFESIERAARLRGVLLMNDGAGNLVITRAATARASSELVQGDNILSAEAEFSMKERFSRYTVKAQGMGLDETNPETDFSMTGSASDAGVSRHRPMVIVAEGAATIASCRTRAQWEATVRLGKSTRVSVTVVGWRQVNGDLWAVNTVVKVNAPGLGLNTELLITEVTFQKSDSGTLTQLTLEPAAAYTPDPTIAAKKDPWRQLVLAESRRK